MEAWSGTGALLASGRIFIPLAHTPRRDPSMSSIYISSTYEDLRDHRTAVHEAVRRVQHIPVGMEDYRASEQRPLDRCLADVRRCRAYIGVIAWRFGFVPRGYSRSITALEYDEAGHHGIPRLVFLSPDEAWPGTLRDANPKRIEAFRAEVREAHVVDWFDSIKDLQYKVVAALKQELGDGIVIPPLLPYRCDRNEQYTDVAQAMETRRSGATIDRGVVVVLVHGKEQQALNKFVQCVQADTTVLLGVSAEMPCAWHDVPWPTERSPVSIEAALLRALSRELRASGSTATDIAGRLRALGTPAVIHSRVYTDHWTTESTIALRGFISFCRNLEISSWREPVVVLLTIDYREPRRWIDHFTTTSRNKAIQMAISTIASDWSGDSHVLVARELQNVTRYHAETWADGEAVQSLVQSADIRADVDKIFSSVEELPMRPLAKELRALLERQISESRR